MGIGRFGDDIHTVRVALNYLKKYKKGRGLFIPEHCKKRIKDRMLRAKTWIRKKYEPLVRSRKEIKNKKKKKKR